VGLRAVLDALVKREIKSCTVTNMSKQPPAYNQLLMASSALPLNTAVMPYMTMMYFQALASLTSTTVFITKD